VNDRASLDIAASYAQLDDAAIIIMHATDWKSIPAENLVAAFQVSPFNSRDASCHGTMVAKEVYSCRGAERYLPEALEEILVMAER
jgi:3-dehydroquinate synthase class II